MARKLNYIFLVLVLVSFFVAILPLTTPVAAVLGGLAVNVTCMGFTFLPFFYVAALICNALTK